ncbi:MAG: PAS domain S-box protein [Sphingomonadales bacterium]
MVGLLEALLDSAPNAAAYLDRHGFYRVVNTRLADLNGCPAAEMIGRSAFDGVSRRFSVSLPAFRRALAGRQSIQQSEICPATPPVASAAAGAALTLEIHYFPHSVDDVVVGVCVYAFDVSDRVQAATGVRSSRERFRRLVVLMPYGIVRTDVTNRILLVNPAAAKMLGYTVEDLIGRSFWDFYDPGERAEQQAYFNTILSERPEPDAYVAKFVRRDGGVIDVLFHWNYEVNESGEVASFIGVMTDVTEQLRSERALRDAKNVAETATREKSRFLAATSHDLRQPLHSLSIMLGLLKEPRGAEEQAGILAAMERALQGAQGLLHSVLELSRLEAGVIAPQLEGIAVADLIHEIEAELGPQMLDNKVVLKIVWTRIRVFSDRTLLKSILYNLISNAIRYTPAGRVVVGVRLKGGQSVSLEVWDTGVGIPRDRQADIFQEFIRLDSKQDKGAVHSLGLGLSIVDQACKLLDYPLTVESRVSRGSVFRVRVPLEPRGQGPASRGHQPTDGGTAPRLQGRVLIVEDDPETALVLSRLAESWGLSARTAATIEEARAAFPSDDPPGLVLAELHLVQPDNGLEVIEAVRNRCSQAVPAILLTADQAAPELARARALAIPVMFKPVNPARLRALVWFVMEER